MANLGYSGTPLAKKLGFKPGFTLYIVNAPDHYWELFSEVPKDLEIQSFPIKQNDIIHYFTDSKVELEQKLNELKSMIKSNGMIWVSWPKKASKVPTDVTEDVIRDWALQIGLVDVKVCAVNHIWSGLKLVIPVKLRPKHNNG